MHESFLYTQLDILAFDRIAWAHSLVSDNYSYFLDNQGYGIYGTAPEDGGILEIGFVEQNPVLLAGPSGQFLIEENGIFILPPGCSFSVSAKNAGLHRHTCAEFLIRCRTAPASTCPPPEGHRVTLPLYIPPSPENNEIFSLIRSIACAKTAQLERSFYNGDHMSMYGVNAGVPKTLVRHLVAYCAETAENEVLANVLWDVLDTPVSPELLPPVEGQIAQKTEDLVGPYELHDFFLYYMLRWGFAPAKVYRVAQKAFAGTYDDATILKWLKTFYRRFFIQQFKRSCLPDGPKVGTVGISPRGDLRMPSDACARIWLDQIEELG